MNTQLRPASSEDSATASDVAMLQKFIEAEFTDGPRTARLPLAISLPLIAALSGGLWIGIVAGLRLLLR